MKEPVLRILESVMNILLLSLTYKYTSLAGLYRRKNCPNSGNSTNYSEIFFLTISCNTNYLLVRIKRL